MSKYSELIKLAEAAKEDYYTPEPWDEDRRYSNQEVAMLDYIRVANPSTVLGLIDERKDLLEALDAAEFRLESFLDAGREMPEPSMEVLLEKVRRALTKARGEI